MLHWLLNTLFSLKVGFCSCHPDVRQLALARVRSQYRVERLASLPRVVNESSGLARRTTDGRTVWTHNDGGGRPMLYGIDLNTGALIDSLTAPGLRNVDWEDLAQADTSRFFIADLGNNANTRRDLVIYLVKKGMKAPVNPSADTLAVTRIAYADQTTFPPKGDTKPGRNFDCEAVFYRRDSLFLLTKNRSGHQVKLYGVPARGGTYNLSPVDSVSIRSMVTGAALSPDVQTLAVLTYGNILFFRLSNKPGSATRLDQPISCLRLPRGQTEGIVFLDDSTLLVSNERGRLYRLRRR